MCVYLCVCVCGCVCVYVFVTSGIMNGLVLTPIDTVRSRLMLQVSHLQHEIDTVRSRLMLQASLMLQPSCIIKEKKIHTETKNT